MLNEIAELERSGKLMVISPKEPPKVSRIEKDKEKLRILYEAGLNESSALLPQILKYINA